MLSLKGQRLLLDQKSVHFFPAVYFCVLVQEYLGLDRDLEPDHDSASVSDPDPNSIGSADLNPGGQK